jgi:putative transposase
VAKRRLRLGKGPAWGDQVGANPTDRAKNGTKRRVLTEADGGPVAVFVAPANRHDSMILRGRLRLRQDILEAVVVEPPMSVAQHLCLDGAFVGAGCDATAGVFNYEPHVRPIGEERAASKARGAKKRHKPRRWVVERTIGWFNRCRGILVRYEKKAENYLGAIQLACALLWYRRLHRLTT